MGDGIGYPAENSAKSCCAPPRKQLTDLEKSIYLKLVALALAGKIVWTSECNGTYAGFNIWVCDCDITVSKCEGDNNWHQVASMCVRGEQVAGDLAAIAKEQYGAYTQKLLDEFMNA